TSTAGTPDPADPADPLKTLLTHFFHFIPITKPRETKSSNTSVPSALPISDSLAAVDHAQLHTRNCDVDDHDEPNQEGDSNKIRDTNNAYAHKHKP
ncbi:hypothetical protein BGZ83_001757, partial [Gryganskiella cystojenkinii]